MVIKQSQDLTKPSLFKMPIQVRIDDALHTIWVDKKEVVHELPTDMRPELVIGFAAETNEIDKNAEEKLNKKSCDWIISNDVSNKDIGFNSDYNEVTIHYKNKDVKKEKLLYKKKSGISDEIVDRIIDQLN